MGKIKKWKKSEMLHGVFSMRRRKGSKPKFHTELYPSGSSMRGELFTGSFSVCSDPGEPGHYDGPSLDVYLRLEPGHWLEKLPEGGAGIVNAKALSDGSTHKDLVAKQMGLKLLEIWGKGAKWADVQVKVLSLDNSKSARYCFAAIDPADAAADATTTIFAAMNKPTEEFVTA